MPRSFAAFPGTMNGSRGAGERWIDVSRPLSPETAVWPGDQKLVLHQRVEPQMVLSSITTSCHVGTHVDALLHLDPDAAPLEDIPLVRFIGPAEVLMVSGCGARVGLENTARGWRPSTRRVLLRTDTHDRDSAIGEGFSGLEPALVHWLADRGVELVGIDTPSVDPFGAELLAHHALAERGMTWLEGLWLGEVEPGAYQLIALPMPLVGVEAAPVRAVLGVCRA